MEVQKFSYHTHTIFSDGRSKLEDMLEQAVKLGWSEIGISDHLTYHETATWEHQGTIKDISSKKEEIKDRINNMKQIAKKYPIKTMIGFEVDFFTNNDWLSRFKTLSKDWNYDYLISGNHYTEDESGVMSVFKIKKYDVDKQRELIQKHFSNIVAAIESKLFSFIAHLDFIRWAGVCGAKDFIIERKRIIEALADTKTPYELNTKGLGAIGDFYPAQWMIEELRDKDVPIVISDDAHSIEQLGRDFDKAEELLNYLGYKNRWKF